MPFVFSMGALRDSPYLADAILGERLAAGRVGSDCEDSMTAVRRAAVTGKRSLPGGWYYWLAQPKGCSEAAQFCRTSPI